MRYDTCTDDDSETGLPGFVEAAPDSDDAQPYLRRHATPASPNCEWQHAPDCQPKSVGGSVLDDDVGRRRRIERPTTQPKQLVHRPALKVLPRHHDRLFMRAARKL